MIRNISIVILLLFGSLIQAQEETVTTKEFVKNTLKNLPNNANDFTQAYMNPLVGNEQLSTPSGSKFDVSLSCPTSNAFLEVMAQTSSTGDLYFLQFSRDKDLDGKIDSVKNFPKPVSGVCTTGLISCTVGTWDDCQWYQWDGQSNNLSLLPVSTGNLSGCYCINSSCGDAGRSQRIISSIVTDLGSAAAQALATHNPQYTISGANTTGPIAKFYGQKLIGCGDGSATTMASYYQNPQNIESAANSYKTGSDGLYQLIANSDSANKVVVETKSCTIKRNLEHVLSNDVNRTCSKECVIPAVTTDYKEAGVHLWIAPYTGEVEISVGRAAGGGSFWTRKWPGTAGGDTSFNGLKEFFLKGGGYGPDITQGESGYARGGWGNKSSKPHPVYPNARGFEIVKDFTVIKGNTYTITIGAGGWSRDDGDNPESKNGYIQIKKKEVRNSCKEWISNSCNDIDNDSKCQLKKEFIDGVQTFKNFHPTGKIPLKKSILVPLSACGLSVDREWEVVEREYQCQTNTEFNFDKGIERNAAIQSSATTENYNDVVGGVSTQRSLTLPDVEVQSNCTNACKTKRKKDKVSVANSGPVTEKITEEWETLYRKCVGDNQDICPNEEKEQIVTQCSCLNEFGTASVMMQSLRQAAQGLICTK